LSGALRDVATSSLYRQLAKLREAGVLQVVAERKARGAVERTYALGERGATVFDAQTLASTPVKTLRSTVRNLLTTLLTDVTSFIESAQFRKRPASILAGAYACDLTDEDYRKAAEGMHRAIISAKKRSAGSSKAVRRVFYAIALPQVLGE
jgi:DNA-binding PadR family transcriptional regulator